MYHKISHAIFKLFFMLESCTAFPTCGQAVWFTSSPSPFSLSVDSASSLEGSNCLLPFFRPIYDLFSRGEAEHEEQFLKKPLKIIEHPPDLPWTEVHASSDRCVWYGGRNNVVALKRRRLKHETEVSAHALVEDRDLKNILRKTGSLGAGFY